MLHDGSLVALLTEEALDIFEGLLICRKGADTPSYFPPGFTSYVRIHLVWAC